MQAKDYREIIRVITNKVLNDSFPGLNKLAKKEAARMIAINVHARMYGANVDGVASPLWRRLDDPEPNVDAQVLLNRNI